MPAAALRGREEAVPPQVVQGAWTPENLQALVDGYTRCRGFVCSPNLTWLSRADVRGTQPPGPHLGESLSGVHRR